MERTSAVHDGERNDGRPDGESDRIALEAGSANLIVKHATDVESANPVVKHVVAAACLAAVVLIGGCSPADGQDLSIPPGAYPDVRQSDHTDRMHGVDIADPYRWMENLEAPELQNWLEAQDSLLHAHVPDRALVESLKREIMEWRQRTTLLPPVIRGPWRFTLFGRGDQLVQNLYVNRHANGPGRHEGNDPPGRLLVDMDAARDDDRYVSTGTISPAGTYVPVLESDGPTRWKTLRILHTENGENTRDRLTGIVAGMPIAWTPDERGFFYARYDIPDDPQAARGKPRIFYHETGTPQSEDRFVWEQPDGDELTINLHTTSDGRYLVLEGSASGGTFSGMFDRIFISGLNPDRPAQTKTRELFKGSDARYATEGIRDGRLIIRTTDGADNMRLITVDPDKPEGMEELLPEAAWPIHAVTEYSDHLLVRYIRDTKTFIRVVSKDGEVRAEFDDLANNIFGLNNNPTASVAFYGITRLVEPGTVFRLDLESMERMPYFRPEVSVDPDAYTSTVIHAESGDGTRIPISLVHRRDLDLDGTAPLFMYGYGAWAWSAFPWQQYMIPWLKRGGIYAIAHVRGGGEFGSEWHEAGIRRNRETWIADYLAAAAHLVDAGYTSPERLVANGGSASGMLPAIAINRRPELIGAAAIDYPFLDMIRMKQFGSGQSYIPEYGDPDNPEDFEVLIGYSPYHRIESGRCYPPTIVQAGSKDETSTPVHAYKYVAALQHAQGCDHPVLLKIAWGAGHSHGSTQEQRAETQAQQLAFLLHGTGVAE